MPNDRKIHVTLKIATIEKRLVRTFPRGSKNRAKYIKELINPIYVEEAPSRRAKRVIIMPTSRFHEIELRILK
jgi:hypothetical protein